LYGAIFCRLSFYSFSFRFLFLAFDVVLLFYYHCLSFLIFTRGGTKPHKLSTPLSKSGIEKVAMGASKQLVPIECVANSIPLWEVKKSLLIPTLQGCVAFRQNGLVRS
jgi:hypothetical protein